MVQSLAGPDSIDKYIVFFLTLGLENMRLLIVLALLISFLASCASSSPTKKVLSDPYSEPQRSEPGVKDTQITTHAAAQPLPEESLPQVPLRMASTDVAGISSNSEPEKSPYPRTDDTNPVSSTALDKEPMQAGTDVSSEPSLPVTPSYAEPMPQAYVPPPEVKMFSMSAPPAVLALETDVLSSMNSAKYADAASTLERAIRIQPKNPELWNVLAKVRLRQHQPGLAEDLAKKSNVLAKSNTDLIRSNWDLIAQARRQKGDIEGAYEALDKARY